MTGRFHDLLRRTSSIKRPLAVAVGLVVGFVAVLAFQLQPPDPESRLPEPFRLAALIQRQQDQNDDQRVQVENLRTQLNDLRSATLDQRADLRAQNDRIEEVGVIAGLTPVAGTGFVVSLDDSTLSSAPTGNVNDLVIHSQDVQAVVNGMWAAGAEAISINGQRLVSTSAVLCVGNTLLINGTVHSPPYEVSAVGADRDLFNNDPLVREFDAIAERFSLGFSVSGLQPLEIPGYNGSIAPQYAEVVTS